MKLESVRIRDFRCIGDLTIDFTDDLGRVRDVTVLAGPNASGKTSALDAIAAALCPATQVCWPRSEMRLAPSRVVRKGAIQTEVQAKVRFSDEEIDTVRRLVSLANEEWMVPHERSIEVRWAYPDPQREHRYGRLEFRPKRGWIDFEGRWRVAHSLHLPQVGFDWFRTAGGVFTFDQERAVGKKIPREVWAIISGEVQGDEPSDRYTTDPRELLLALAVRAQARQEDTSDGVGEAYGALRKYYAEICRPRSIVGPVNMEDGLEMEFSDGAVTSPYNELSSGEKMVLSLLARIAEERIHSSIVLIDEIELHLHPLWQRKLLGALPQMGSNNQFIVTTHSPHVRDVTPPQAMCNLGELGESQ